MTSTVNPLANPKGVQLLCEICQKPAHLLCTRCRVTFYCGKEHQSVDWIGIHEKICDQLKILRTPHLFIASEDEREAKRLEMLDLKRRMLETTRTVGQKFLFQSKYEHAIPAAMQSLRFAIDIHGISSIELVPSYLILAEASIGLHRIMQAEEYLAQAHWTVTKTPNAENSIKSRVHRILGLLSYAKEDFQSAIKHFAEDIFYSSEMSDPDDIRTSGGYFYQANVFEKIGKWSVADSLYRRVFVIWFEYLLKMHTKRLSQVFLPEGVSSAMAELMQKEVVALDEAQEAEAVKVLNTIEYVYRTHNPTRQAHGELTAYEVERMEDFKVFHVRLLSCLGVLYFLLKNYEQMAAFAIEAKRLQAGEYRVLVDEDLGRLLDDLERLTRKFVPHALPPAP